MRLEGWEDRLLEVVAEHERRPFEWGVSDCFTMSMDAVLALTGIDPWAEQRDYSNAFGAQRRLTELGFADAGDAFAAKLDRVHPAKARRGDIGVADYPGAVLGGGVIVLGAQVLGKGEDGCVRLPRERLTRTFKVGW